MSLRIAMVGACPYPVPQGSQVLLGNTSMALKQRGHEVHLVVYGYGTGEPPAALHVHRAWRVPFGNRIAAGPSLAKPWQDLALVARLRRLLREQKIDVVHAHNYEGLLVALTAGFRPVVYHAHNAMSDELPHFFRGSRAFGAWLDRTFPRRADHIIAPHSELAEYLVKCDCRAEQITVLPPPMDASLFPWRRETNGQASVLYTGNLDAYQNLHGLMQAMRRVREQVKGARLTVATSAPVVSDDDGIEVAPTPDFASLCEVLEQDAVVACPRVSWSGYPIKVLNAMAAGRPVVAYESAGYPITSGFNGVKVPDNDEGAFAAALVELMTNPQKRAVFGANARATIAAQFNYQEIADGLEGVYAGVLTNLSR